MWDEIIYPIPNFNGCTVEVWEWKSNFVLGCNFLSMLGLKVDHVSKRGPRNPDKYTQGYNIARFLCCGTGRFYIHYFSEAAQGNMGKQFT